MAIFNNPYISMQSSGAFDESVPKSLTTRATKPLLKLEDRLRLVENPNSPFYSNSKIGAREVSDLRLSLKPYIDAIQPNGIKQSALNSLSSLKEGGLNALKKNLNVLTNGKVSQVQNLVKTTLRLAKKQIEALPYDLVNHDLRPNIVTEKLHNLKSGIVNNFKDGLKKEEAEAWRGSEKEGRYSSNYTTDIFGKNSLFNSVVVTKEGVETFYSSIASEMLVSYRLSIDEGLVLPEPPLNTFLGKASLTLGKIESDGEVDLGATKYGLSFNWEFPSKCTLSIYENERHQWEHWITKYMSLIGNYNSNSRALFYESYITLTMYLKSRVVHYIPSSTEHKPSPQGMLSQQARVEQSDDDPRKGVTDTNDLSVDGYNGVISFYMIPSAYEPKIDEDGEGIRQLEVEFDIIGDSLPSDISFTEWLSTINRINNDGQ